MSTLKNRVATLEGQIVNLTADAQEAKVSAEELQTDIEESEDRQMTALAEFKAEFVEFKDEMRESLKAMVLRAGYG